MPIGTQQRERKKNMALAPLRKESDTAAAPEMTTDVPEPVAAQDAQPDSSENLYLIGRPTLKQFLRFVKDNAIHPPSSGDLVEEWRSEERRVGKECPSLCRS